MVDWSGAWLHVPNAVHTALLKGDWLKGHVQSGTMTVLSSEEGLQRINEEKMQKNISVLKCPRVWRERVNGENLQTNLLKGNVKYEIEWGNLYNNDFQLWKKKRNVKESVNIEILVNYM